MPADRRKLGLDERLDEEGPLWLNDDPTRPPTRPEAA
jgi:hypothetical protein